jgi:hypothetical protein
MDEFHILDPIKIPRIRPSQDIHWTHSEETGDGEELGVGVGDAPLDVAEELADVLPGRLAAKRAMSRSARALEKRLGKLTVRPQKMARTNSSIRSVK